MLACNCFALEVQVADRTSALVAASPQVRQELGTEARQNEICTRLRLQVRVNTTLTFFAFVFLLGNLY